MATTATTVRTTKIVTTQASTTTTTENATTTTTETPTTTTIPPTTEATTIPTSSVQTTGTTVPSTTPGAIVHKGVIAGAVVGAVFVVAVIAIAVFFLLRRRLKRKRSSREARFIPAKEQLERMDEERTNRAFVADTHYGNVDDDGTINQNTDPAIGADGYLKKDHGYVMEQSKAKHDKKKIAKDRSSVPPNLAPSPPIEASKTGKLGKSSSKVSDKDQDSGYIDGRTVGGEVDKEAYVNLDGQKKGGPVLGVPPKFSANANNDNQFGSNSKSKENKAKNSKVPKCENLDNAESDDKTEDVHKNGSSVPPSLAPSPSNADDNNSKLGQSLEKVSEKKQGSGYVVGRILAPYVNLNGQEKGGPVFGVSPKPPQKFKKANDSNSNSKSQENKAKESSVEPSNADKAGSEDQRVYENTGSSYANVNKTPYYNEGIVASSPDHVEEAFYEDES